MAQPNTISLDDLKPIVADAAKEFDIPEDSIWRKLRAENSGSPEGASNLKTVRTNAVSPKDAKGIMQVTQVALDDVMQQGLIPSGTQLNGLSPVDQIRVGAAYIKRLRNSYSTDPAVEDAMYNFGPKARFQMDRLPAETQDYLKKSGAKMADSDSTTTNSGSAGPAISFGSLMGTSKDLLAALLGNNKQQNDNIQTGAESLSNTLQQRKVAADSAVAGQQAAIDSAAVTAGKAAEISFQQAKIGELLQKQFNMDPTVAGDEISTSLAEVNRARDARVSARAEYDKAASVGILDDPLAWLVNQVKLPSLAAKNNALADAEDTAMQNITTRTAALKNAQNTVVANVADQQKQVAVEQAKNVQDMASAKLLEEKAKNLTAEANGKLQLMNLVDKMGDNARATIGTVISLQDREEQAQIRNAAKKDINDKKKLDQEDEDRLNSRLKTLSDSLGLVEPMTVKRLRQLQNKKDQDVWLTAATTNQMGETLQSSLGFYLENGSRASIMNQGGASVYNTAQKLKNAGAEQIGTVEQQAHLQGVKMNRAEVAEKAFKNYTDSVVASMSSPTAPIDLSSARYDKQYNPYIAPFKSFTLAVQTRPELSGLKGNAVTTTIKTLIDSGAVTSENLSSDQQQQVFNAIQKKVYAREITPAKAAADVSVYMQAAGAWNRQMNGYTLFSLPAQDSYMYTLKGAVGKKVDLYNPASLENAMMKNVISQQMEDTGRLTGMEQGIL